MQVDVLIDKLTDCLVERETGNIVDTKYLERTTKIEEKECSDWKFNWNVTQKDGYTVYELFVEDDDTFTSKSDLVEYYKKELKAVEVMPRRLVIFADAAEILLDKYIRK